jgi:hypothetical protein
MTRTSAMRLARIGVSAAIISILFVQLPFEALRTSWGRIGLEIWIGVLAVFVAGHTVAAMKWRMLMEGLHTLPLRTLFRAHFSGLVANFYLPGGAAGGDLVRAVSMARRSGRTESVVVASFVDRLVDTAALAILAGAGALWLGRVRIPTGILAVAGAALAVIALIVAAAAPRVAARLQRAPVRGTRRKLIDALLFVIERPVLPAAALALSIAVQGTFVWLNFRLGQHAGVDAAFAAWLMAWPLAKLTATLPISVGGLGVREAALIAYMAPFGVAPAAVLAAGLAWQTILVVGGIAGWLVTWPVATRTPIESPTTL